MKHNTNENQCDTSVLKQDINVWYCLMIQQLFRYPLLSASLSNPEQLTGLATTQLSLSRTLAQRNLLQYNSGDFSYLFLVSGFPHFPTAKKPKTPTLW